MDHLVESWQKTAETMRKLAEKDVQNALMWKGAASAFDQAARELRMELSK